jgi:hypothetical protein
MVAKLEFCLASRILPIVSGELGVVTGLQGEVAFGPKSIDYFTGTGGIRSQTMAYGGVDVSSQAGSSITVDRGYRLLCINFPDPGLADSQCNHAHKTDHSL